MKKRGATQETLVVGGIPTVHLLPPEVLQRRKSRVLHRRLVAGIGLVAVAALAGTGLAASTTFGSERALADEQMHASALLAQQHKYSDVLSVQSDVTSILAAQKLATAQEISWDDYIDRLRDTLPKKMRIASLTASLDAVFVAAPAVETPLQGPRIATLTVTVTTPQKSISDWLDRLRKLPGYVDQAPGTVEKVEETNDYRVVVVVHIDEGALANRFADKEDTK